MKLDLKAHLISLASSDEVKGLVCDIVDSFVSHSDNNVDDRMAAGLRAALFVDTDA